MRNLAALMNSNTSSAFAEDPSAASLSAMALRADAARAVAALGVRAEMKVPVASLAFYGARLGWPEWLFTGSNFTGPLPPQIPLADDLLISANLFAHVDCATLVHQSINMAQPAAGAVTRLTLASGPTMGAIFSHLNRIMLLGSPHCQPEMRRIADRAFIGLVGTVPLGGLLDYLGLLFIAFHYRVIEDLMSADLAGATINLTLAEGGYSAAIRQLFRCNVCFGAAVNELSMPAEWPDKTNPGHDPQLWALAGERLRAAEAQFRDDDSIQRLRQRISDLLTENRRAPRLTQVAQAEGTSPRSLVRHIAAAGHSFHGLVDHERRLRTAHLINDPALSIRAIAEQLGFPDVSSFGRKFRKWFGDSPACFRRRGA
jgi:AraC-like DNA-binding protein